MVKNTQQTTRRKNRMLKSIAKIIRLLKGIPKVRVDNNNRFMRQLNTKIKEFEDGRHNKSSD